MLRLFAFTLLMFPVMEAAGHAVVIENSLQNSALEANKAASIRLQFNSNVELALSRASLISKGDVEQGVTIKSDGKPGRIIAQLPPLTVGEYALRYRVFGADGHLTEDIIHFSVGQSEESDGRSR